MALTAVQQTQIRAYLGYPDLWRYKDTRLEGVIGNTILGPEAEERVTLILRRLVVIDNRMFGDGVTAGVILSASGIEQVDEIKFFAGMAIKEVVSIGRKLINQLSIIFGVPLNADYYGVNGYPGDTYSAGGLGSGGGGNMIPHG